MERKFYILNKIVRFGDLNFFSLVMLSELIIKCVIGFGGFVRISKDE